MRDALISALLAGSLLLASCAMSDKEWALRDADIKAKAAHPTTYVPVRIKGPVTIPSGGEMIVTVPNMPYQHTAIPDGQAVNASLVKDLTHTAAMAGVAAYAIHEAAGDTVTTTTTNAGK